MPSTRYNTALAFIKAFETLDGQTFHSLYTPTCIHSFAPASCNPPAPSGRDHFSTHIGGLKTILKSFPVYPKEIIENETENQVVIWATSETVFLDEAMDDGIPKEDWSYKGEYIFILTMNESGEGIEKVFEFLDSKGTDRLRDLMKRGRDNLEKRSLDAVVNF